MSTIFNNLLSKPQLLQNAKNSQTRNDHSKPASTGASTQSLKDRLSTAGLDLSTSSSNASVTFSTITEEASAKEKVDDSAVEDSS
ncbi:hypothetical protein GJ496_010897 [Pomphorhynchus laevis]|nr:hypothetical protein GJ496_010897 [Pomphorhynchus laevis]